MAQTLGNAIKTQRKKLKLSIAKLTKLINMDPSYVHKIENKSFLPSPKIIEKIANELKCPSLVELYCEAKKDELNKKLLAQRKNLAKTKTRIIKKIKG
jgi:transcriptional regulator with XRE-family HTH domain